MGGRSRSPACPDVVDRWKVVGGGWNRRTEGLDHSLGRACRPCRLDRLCQIGRVGLTSVHFFPGNCLLAARLEKRNCHCEVRSGRVVPDRCKDVRAARDSSTVHASQTSTFPAVDDRPALLPVSSASNSSRSCRAPRRPRSACPLSSCRQSPCMPPSCPFPAQRPRKRILLAFGLLCFARASLVRSVHTGQTLARGLPP